MDPIVLLDSEDLNLISQIVAVNEATVPSYNFPELSESDISCILRELENYSSILRLRRVIEQPDFIFLLFEPT